MELSSVVLVTVLTLGNGQQFCAIGDQYDNAEACQQEAKELDMSFRKNPGIIFKNMESECVPTETAKKLEEETNE